MTQLASRAPVLLAVAVAGCASVSPEQRDYYDRSAQQLRATPTAVVADSCVLRDEIGEDFLLRRTALERGETLLRESASYLRSKGYQVTTQSQPFICGAVGPHLEPVRIAETAETLNSAGAPTALSLALTASSRTPAVAAAWGRLFTAVTEARVASRDDYPTGIKLGADDGQLLLREIGTRQFWLIQYSDVEVSAGKTFGVGMLTGVLTLGLTGGAAYLVSAPIDTLGYSVTLVDLDRRQLIWSKQTLERRQETDGSAWIAGLFDPFLSGTPASSPSAAQVDTPAPAPAPAVYRPVAAPAAPSAAPAVTPAPAIAARPSPAAVTAAATVSGSLPQTASLRSAPTPSAPILRQLPANTAIRIDSELRNGAGRWLYVKGDGFHGWLLADEAGLR